MTGTLRPPMGYGRASRFMYIATAGQTTFSGPDSSPAPVTMNYVPGYVEVAVNGLWLPPTDYTATNGSAIVFGSALSAGDIVYAYALSAMSVADAVSFAAPQTLTAAQQAQARDNAGVQKKNYVINGTMMVSQENGTTAGTIPNYYPADQWFVGFSSSGTFTAAQVASVSPAGSPNRIRFTVTAADAAVGAADIIYICQRIEGLRSADLLFGSASAKTVTISFGVKAPAGTYCLTLINSANNRSYVAEYVISAGEANTDVTKFVTIAGDQSGTWLKDTSVGIEVRWGLMSGSTFQQAAGAWGTVNPVGSANQFNIMGTNGNVFELFDVGLYEGTVAPPFVVPDFFSELALCQRYFEMYTGAGSVGFNNVAQGAANTTSIITVLYPFRVRKRVSPTFSYSAVGNFTILYNGFGSANAVTAMTMLYYGVDGATLQATGTGSPFTLKEVAAIAVNNGDTNARLFFNARL